MGFVVPLLMCAVFIFFWIALCRFILAVYVFSVKRTLLRSSSLDRDNAAGLLSVYFGARSLFRKRWFPKRSPIGTVYAEIPCILILGRKIFVLEICPYPGVIHNTKEASWRIDPPEEYQRKEIRVQNPVFLAEEHAEILRELLGVLKLPFPVSVESMAVLTDKRHTLTQASGGGLYSLSEAISYLSGFAARSKPSRKKMKSDTEKIREIFDYYSLSRARAAARNDRIRRQKK